MPHFHNFERHDPYLRREEATGGTLSPSEFNFSTLDFASFIPVAASFVASKVPCKTPDVESGDDVEGDGGNDDPDTAAR